MAAVGGKITAAAWNVLAADTGWTNISATFSNGFTAGSSQPQYRVIDGICYLRGDYWHPTTAPGSSWIVAQTLPVGARPTQNAFFMTYPIAGTSSLFVTTGGIIEIASTLAVASSTGYTLGGISYPVN